MKSRRSQHDQILKIAVAVRAAIEACKPDELPWRTFPKGACGDTCLVLGQVLHEEGFEGAEYVCGNKYRNDGKPYSHAWLRYDGLIIDITADQFPEVRSKVIVIGKSECITSETRIARSLVYSRIIESLAYSPSGISIR